MKFLPDCLNSVFSQSYNDFSVFIIDNASTDGTLDFIRQKYPQINIFRNNKNIGFGAAHNQGIKIALLDLKKIEKTFILIINSDVILENDYLEKIIKIIEKDNEIAAVSGKILKIYTNDSEINEKVKTQNIDTVGLKIFKSRRVIDRGENETDRGQYDSAEQVFGISGACALYRLSALEDTKIPVDRLQFEYFDEDFFAYKEDIDLSYRLRWRNWKIYYYPLAICYHHRQVFGGKVNFKNIISRRKKRSPLLKYYSYRNHLFLIIKNESLINLLKDFLFIFSYEFIKFLYFLFFEPKTIKAVNDIFRNLMKMIKKRQWIMKNKKIKSASLRRWFN
ncbi:MAG: glycosyltransferase family 2 protein [Desulfobulbaceae bacterium]|nr:glycosyltransferase family 2 protein [Desulfobulbaceae bacterium]